MTSQRHFKSNDRKLMWNDLTLVRGKGSTTLGRSQIVCQQNSVLATELCI